MVFLYFVPLLLLTLFFHIQYSLVVKDAEQQHRESLVHHQAALLELCRTEKFDLALLDLKMPGMNGQERLRKEFSADADRAVKLGEIASQESPRGILRRMKELDDQER